MQIVMDILLKLVDRGDVETLLKQHAQARLGSLDWLCYFAENPDFYELAKFALDQKDAANPGAKMHDGVSPRVLAELHLHRLVRPPSLPSPSPPSPPATQQVAKDNVTRCWLPSSHTLHCSILIGTRVSSKPGHD